MTKSKTTKKALLASALSLILCFTMLLGTTFAWFTDSVTSTGNIIQSGNLDVKMEWKDATTTGAQQVYKDASEGAIFNYDRWEPGYVEAKNIKISNVGTLALKYHLNIAANGGVSDLADVIDVYFAEGEYTLANREMTELTRVGTLSDILEGMPTNMAGDLEANTADTVTIALKMQESAGNYYQDMAIGTNFSVVLMATQDNVEKDSFDENYDDIEIPEMDVQTINGVTYGTTIDGDYVMISVDDYTLTTFTVNDKVTVLGTGDGVNDIDRVFGKNAPLTSLTLPEGLAEIKDYALSALPNLTTVNFPSTLKTIGIQSFRQTGMTELRIPKNVETIKSGAFRDMANLTTVTVEGNVAFSDYAFRSCPKLTSIYLLGDDVTFAGGQFATHSDNGDANGITIYVKNATVAARLYAAQTSAYDYEVKVLGDKADGSDATEVVQAKDTTQLNTAIANDKKDIIVIGAELTEKISLGRDVNATFVHCTITGDNSYMYANNITFQNCTFNSGVWGSAIHLDTLSGKLVVNNCTFVSGQVKIGTSANASAVFNDCVFGATAPENGIWSEKGMRFYCETTFNNCEFNNRVVLAGSEGLPLTFNGCTMNGGAPVYFNAVNDGIIASGAYPVIPDVTINN